MAKTILRWIQLIDPGRYHEALWPFEDPDMVLVAEEIPPYHDVLGRSSDHRITPPCLYTHSCLVEDYSSTLGFSLRQGEIALHDSKEARGG